jgi:hypothetical protein
MRTGNMESTRSKSKKNKINLKPKIKSNLDEIDDAETQLLSPVERTKVNHLATTPVTPAGNIVDMQGSLNQVTPDKVEDDKSDNKAGAKAEFGKNENSKDKVAVESCQKESNTSGESDKIKSGSDNKVELQSSCVVSKQFVDQTEISSPTSDSSTKQIIPDNHGKLIFLN